MVKYNSRGVVLFIVLSMILVVTILANIILGFILSQSRFTYHQTSRIQAYYAAQAGINYALEKLRLGDDDDWPVSTTESYTHTLCRSGCDINDPDLPSSVRQVSILVEAPGSGLNETRRIKATVTYTPPTS